MMYGMDAPKKPLWKRAVNKLRNRNVIEDMNVDTIRKNARIEERVAIVKYLEGQISHEPHECRLTCTAHKQIYNLMNAEGKYD